jgi:membrane protein DedA with SNARE-associated domain
MQHVALLISTYGVFILLPIMIIEGPIITVIASFLASLGLLSLPVVYVLALLGNIIGDAGYYAIGRFGRERFIKKYGKHIGLHEKHIEYLEHHYENHFFKTILIAKVTEAPIVPTLVAAGLAKVDFKKYILLTGAIEIPKVALIVAVGYYFGRFYVTIGNYFKDGILAAGLTILVVAVAVFLYKKVKAKQV